MRRYSSQTKHVLAIATIFIVGMAYLIVQEPNKDITRSTNTSPCTQKEGRVITVDVKNNTFYPNTIEASRCDYISITNRDDVTVSPAFGSHTSHVNYAGFKQIVIGRDENQRIQLTEIGEFRIHDDYRGIASVDITVR
jgi:hypothetical protein